MSARPAAPAVAGAAVVAIAVVAWLVVGRVALNYDTAYGLVWGDQLLRDGAPEYEAFGSPTPHPALVAAGAIASAFGPSTAESLMLAAGPLSLGLLLVAAFALARTLHSTAAGVVAVALLAASGTLVILGVTASKDVPYVALVLFALKLEAERSRRGTPVLALLAVAGLIRPDAWALSAAYWLWLLPATDGAARMRTGALALVSPAVWIGSDALVTGRPLFSFTYTRDLADTLGRGTGAGNVPRELLNGFEILLGPPGIVLGAVGAAVVLLGGGRAGRVVLGVLAILVAGFAVQGLGELPLTARVLLLPATLLAVCAGVGGAEVVRVGAGRSAGVGVAASAVLATAVLASAHARLDDARSAIAAARVEGRLVGDLTDLMQQPAASRAMAVCPQIAVTLAAGPPGPVQIPYVALWSHRDPDVIVPLERQVPDPGAVLLPTRVDHAAAVLPPAVARSRSWRISAVGCGPTPER